eukprot:TRINITY_DN4186_c1_g2_i4.p2 TRINITY_DN4186_c1_g2~~TRINITY_DN4186_c1_g2_i4.p2  ORF type:complete len:320 (+),score=-27.35 TRINITY_DN4186_c1_g2_i4:658-1617(+)
MHLNIQLYTLYIIRILFPKLSRKGRILYQFQLIKFILITYFIKFEPLNFTIYIGIVFFRLFSFDTITFNDSFKSRNQLLQLINQSINQLITKVYYIQFRLAAQVNGQMILSRLFFFSVRGRTVFFVRLLYICLLQIYLCMYLVRQCVRRKQLNTIVVVGSVIFRQDRYNNVFRCLLCLYTIYYKINKVQLIEKFPHSQFFLFSFSGFRNILLFFVRLGQVFVNCVKYTLKILQQVFVVVYVCIQQKKQQVTFAKCVFKIKKTIKIIIMDFSFMSRSQLTRLAGQYIVQNQKKQKTITKNNKKTSYTYVYVYRTSKVCVM